MKNLEKILILVILTLISIIIYKLFLKRKKIELFKNKEMKEEVDLEDRFVIKKTLNFNKIWHCKKNNVTIWEPESDGEYYPVGNIITKGITKPKKPAILVKSNISNKLDRPLRYEIITYIILPSLDNSIKKVGIWSPIPNKGYKSLGHIFEKGYRPPSIHRIRCVPKSFTNLSNVDNIIYEDNNKNNMKGYNLWSISDSNYFIGNDMNDYLEPIAKVHSFNYNKLQVDNNLHIKKTKHYKFIWKGHNSETNKSVSIWRPVNTKKYVSLGDIVSDGKNPNENLETILVHKEMVKPCEGFGTKPVLTYFIDKQNKISFWKPIPPKDYGCLGYVVTLDSNEPSNNNIIYCVPLKYLNVANKNDKTLIWNTIQLSVQRLSIWKDLNNFFVVNNNYKQSNEIQYKLNDNFLYLDRDMLDISQDIQLKYTLHKNNRELYNSSEREELFVNSLISRLGISKNRLKNISFNNSKIMKMTIVSRTAGSKEHRVSQIIENIENQISNNSLKINNSKNDGYIANIVFLDVANSKFNEKIPLNNTKFITSLLSDK